MAQPVYKVWFARYKEPWYKLSIEDQNKLTAQNAESLKQVGAEEIIFCNTMWSSEEWLAWGVEKYPNIEAIQKHADYLFSINWFQYLESKTYLGTEMPTS
ncbi:MAG TPA: hypothetical protein VLD65_12945 [Anaerolineales bacterium]|nr:hypothetical protein [Anaerolineales bacterium]